MNMILVIIIFWGCTTGNAAMVAHSTKKNNKRKRFRDRRATFTTVYVVGC
jgi:hypothetical protein